MREREMRENDKKESKTLAIARSWAVRIPEAGPPRGSLAMPRRVVFWILLQVRESKAGHLRALARDYDSAPRQEMTGQVERVPDNAVDDCLSPRHCSGSWWWSGGPRTSIIPA
jgi:hypothetical protein